MGDDFKIRVHNVSKILGPKPREALAKVEAGLGKSELLSQTGRVLGLRDISLDIRKGETFVIMGLSGSGKSTLIRHFNRLIDPTAGHILIDGEDVMKLDERGLRELRRHKISMVFQRFALLPHKTVLDNVAYGLMVAGEKPAVARKRAQEQIDLVGLSGFEASYPAQLSGGMQQRVGLARALATNCEILLMDEAFSALDPLIRNDMQSQLKDIQARLHKTIVFITHDLDEALLLGDHIAILKDGELRQTGTGNDILMAPADEYVARFVRDVNRARIVTCGALARPVPVVQAPRKADPGASWTILRGSDGSLMLALPAHMGGGSAPCPAITISAEATVEAAFGHLSKGDQPLVVVDGDDIVGLVEARHVLAALDRTDQQSEDRGTRWQ